MKLSDALRAFATFEDRATDPATPAAGRGLVYFKDGKLHSRDDAGTVVEYGGGGGGGGALTLISDEILAGTAATVTFSSIPASYRSLRLIFSARSTTSATLDAAVLQFNGDTGANYDVGRNRINNTTASHSHESAQSDIIVANIAAGTATSGRAGWGDLIIPHYRSGFHKHLLSTGSLMPTSTADTNWRTGVYAGQWRNTGVITQIQLSCSLGSFAAGSSFSLYGLS